MKDCLNNTNICFIGIIDGDCVNEYDGKKTENGIMIPISVKAPAGCNLTLNGISMKELDGVYTAEIELYGYRNTLTVKDNTNNTSESIR